MTHDELITELEKATGPDRKLDEAIYCTILSGVPVTALSGVIYTTDLEYCPPYTASLDAALTLVPNDASWSLEPDSAWIRWMGKDDVDEAQGHLFQRGGKCTAIALCIAALKARGARR